MDGEPTFGRWLKRRRKALDLTQGDLARQITCSVWTIRKIEMDKLRPSKPIAERLADALGLVSSEREACIRWARTGSPIPSVQQSAAAQPSAQPQPLWPSNLPAELTPLIGRAQEREAICDLLQQGHVRLLTLCGPPGIGKTLLALHVAAAGRTHYRHGVFLITLAPISDPALVISTIAQTLGIGESGTRPLLDTLKEELRGRQILLILDNFEQVSPAAPIVGELLADAPDLKALVTSRTLLRVRSEYEFPVPPLALPNLRRLPPLHVLAGLPAVALFVARARAVKPDFALNEENATAIADICVRLEGLPLAIELAAARIRLLSPTAMLPRLSSRLAMLSGGPYYAPARQQSLHTLFDWSYDLLEPGERSLFARLGVFVGGCTLAAIEAICGDCMGAGVFRRPPSLLDGLAALLDHHLLWREHEADGEPRFMMLETIREYALERLAIDGTLAAVRQDHAGYYLALAEQAEPELLGARQGIWLDRIDREHDNLRAALHWAITQDAGAVALRLCDALWRFWMVRGHLSEGRRWLEAVLVAGQAQPAELRAKILYGAGLLAMFQADYVRARPLFEQTLDLARHSEDRQQIADTLHGLGILAMYQGNYALAWPNFEESLALAREIEDTRCMANCLHNLGLLAMDQANYVQAQALSEEGLALMRVLANQRGIASSLNNLGGIALYQADYERAEPLLQEGLALAREMGHKQLVASVLDNLTALALEQRDYPRATAYSRESLALLRELGDKNYIAKCLESLAEVAGVQGLAAHAAHLYGAAETLRAEIDSPRSPAAQPRYTRYLTAARAQADPNTWTAAWDAGRTMTLEQVIGLALDGERG